MIDVHHLHQWLPQNGFELVTDITATVAIASPWWLPALKEASDIAGLMLPIFGIVWLIVQIGFKFYLSHKGKRS